MHFEQFKVNVSAAGEPIKRRKKGANHLAPGRITHYEMKKWIENAGIDDETKAALLEKIKRYPANTMNHFFDNIYKHIDRIREKRRKKEKE